MSLRQLAVLLASLAVLHAVPAWAQQPGPADARWTAWFGCWVPAARAPEDAPTLCVLPADDGAGVRMRSFVGDREILSETIVPDGSRQALSDKACRGDRVSRWDRTGTRVFSNATLTCDGQPTVTTSAISSLVRTDVMLDVQVSTRDGREAVRARRLMRSVAAPAPVAEAMRAIRPVRVTPAIITAADVVDASAAVTPTTVEAWLAESGARASVDRRGLVLLVDARVEERVIDLLVAMAYPQKFDVRRTSSSGGGGLFGGGVMDAGFYPGVWSSFADLYPYGAFGYGFGAFGFPYFLGGSYYQPGSLYYVPGGGGGAPVPGAADTHGQVINGQGYTRIQPREPYRGTATASEGGTRSSSGGSYEGSAGSGGSSSGGVSPGGYSGGGGGGGGTGLTAVPR